jgi:hypothetical protein
MKTRTITFNIPRWVPTRYQWAKWKKKVKLFFFPPRCYACNCKIPVEYPVYYKYRTGHHMGYDNVQSEFAVSTHGTKFCASCLKQYIHQLDLSKGTCELCRAKNVGVFDYHNNKKGTIITFLWHWWNGRNYCLTCVDDLLDTGKVKNAY